LVEAIEAVAGSGLRSFNHFAIGDFELARALSDNHDAHAECGKHTGVFDANDAATHDVSLGCLRGRG
jgi:hypothetical protein